MSAQYALGRIGRGRLAVSARNVRHMSSKVSKNAKSMSTMPALDNDNSLMKIGGPAAWTGNELQENKWWGYQIPDSALAELDSALKHASTTSIDWDGDVPLNVDQSKFPLKAMGDILAEMSDELENGSGACMLNNIPIEKYSLTELSVLYLGMCSYVGNVVNQSSAGLRSKSRGYGQPLGHVKAEMKGKTPLDGKQANNYFRLHTDRCDVISLLSVRTASRGGHGRVASAVAIHDEMVNRAPDLVPLLYQPIERIWEGGERTPRHQASPRATACHRLALARSCRAPPPPLPSSPCAHLPRPTAAGEGVIALPIWAFEEATGKFTTQISPSYIENAQFVNGVRKLTAGEIEAIDLIEEIGLEIGHDFLQEPGQLTFLNNHLVYHGRTAWKFAEADEVGLERDNIDNGRLLLRAWVSPYNSRPLPDTPTFNEMWGDVRAGMPRGGLEPAVKAGIKAKPPELIEAYATGKADYYGLYKRKFEGEDVTI